METALKSIGWGWDDRGDIDFAAHFEGLGLRAENGAGHHASVLRYREWITAGMTENFSTWVGKQNRKRAREGEGADAPGTPSSTSSSAHGHSSGGKPKEVVNGQLVGVGIELVHNAARAAVSDGEFLLTVGGDHSIAAGSISALYAAYPEMAVVWVDAHADANTPESSPSMHYHGMPAAHLLGWFESRCERPAPIAGFEWFPNGGVMDESRLAFIGLRDIDAEEGRMLRDSNVHVYTMREVDKYGIARVIEMALKAVDPNGRRPLHLSLDVDAVDPHYAPGTGTCARGGLTYREIHYVCEEMAETGRLVGMDLVEINPGLDPPPPARQHGDNADLARASPTVSLGVELALSALGKTILG